MALLLVLCALVVLGGLAAGLILVASQERLVGRNLLRRQQALAAAEAGAEEAALMLRGVRLSKLVGWAGVAETGVVASGWYRRTVEQRSPSFLFVKAEGFSPDSLARQRVGLLLRVTPMSVSARGAFTTRGQVALAGSVLVDGGDATPGGWVDCPPADDPVPGVRTPTPDEIDDVGCIGGPCVKGAPPVQRDSTLDSEPSMLGGSVPLDSLKIHARPVLTGGSIRIEPTLAGASCNVDDPYNWGDPEALLGACRNYFPVVWIEGDAMVFGERGQGVLLVNGNLSLRGGFSFYGLVLVGGTIDMDGAGGRVVGAVVALNRRSARSALVGEGGISFSSCAVDRALAWTATVARVPSRAWVGLY